MIIKAIFLSQNYSLFCFIENTTVISLIVITSSVDYLTFPDKKKKQKYDPSGHLTLSLLYILHTGREGAISSDGDEISHLE